MSRKSRNTAPANQPAVTPPPLLADPGDTLHRWLPILALIILAFLTLSPVLRAVYIWDDADWLTDCPVVKDPATFYRIWTDISATPHYYPLVFTTFWLEYRLWGLGSIGPDGILRGAGYHFDNLLLHLGSVLLIFHTLKRLNLPSKTLGAFLAAAIFAIHPVNVESVAWVAERKNCLCGFFFFAAIYCGLRFFNVFDDAPTLETPAKNPWKFYAATLLLFIAAMLSKTVACVLPAVFLLLIWWRRGRITLKEILLNLPFFAIAVAGGALTSHFETTRVGTTGPDWNFSILQRLLIAGTDLWFYIGKIFVPSPVMQVYPRFDIVAGKPVTNPLYYLAPIAYLALIAIFFALRKKISRGPVTAVLFFAGVLTPALGFFNFYTMLYTFVTDHYQYLACIGIIVLAVESILLELRYLIAFTAKKEPVTQQKRLTTFASALVGGGILLALAILANRSADLYSNDADLWAENVVHNPRSYVTWSNLGYARLNQRPPDVKGSIEALSIAISLAPNDWHAYQNLGILYLDANMPDKGLEYLTKADGLMPPAVRANRAKFFEARAKAISDLPNLEGGRFQARYGAHYVVAKHYEMSSEWNKAIPEYLADLQENPDNIESIFNVGNCYYALDNPTVAAQWFQKAIDARPNYANAWFRLGLCELELNRTDDGQKAILKARDLDSNLLDKYPEYKKALTDQFRQGPRGIK